MNELGNGGAGDRPVLVEIDGTLVGDQIWTTHEEVHATYLMQHQTAIPRTCGSESIRAETTAGTTS